MTNRVERALADALRVMLDPDSGPARILSADNEQLRNARSGVPAALPVEQGSAGVIFALSDRHLPADRAEQLAHTAATHVGEQGVCVVAGRVRSRRRMVRALRNAGLEIERHWLTLASDTSALRLCPIRPEAIAYVGRDASVRRRAMFAVIGRLAGFRVGRAALSALLPNACITLTPPRTTATWSWLSAALTDEQPTSAVIMSVGWRPDAPVLLHGFHRRSPKPKWIAKVMLADDRGEPTSDREAAALRDIGVRAQVADVHVPTYLGFRTFGDRSALFQSCFDGRAAAALLRDDAGIAGYLQSRLTKWLIAWGEVSRLDDPESRDAFLQRLSQQARDLAPLLARGDLYLDWLTARCTAITGENLPLVAAHNDLTMANVLLDNRRELAVIDWEEATNFALPLTDLMYALTDIELTAGRHESRLSAFTTCCAASSAATFAVERYLTAFNLDAETATLCNHACWIQHAHNEQFRDAGTNGAEFLAVLDHLATQVATNG